MLRTNLRDTKQNTPGHLVPGVFGVVRLLVRVTVMVAVVFFLGRLVHHRALCRSHNAARGTTCTDAEGDQVLSAYVETLGSVRSKRPGHT
jgi:hypothetical protein